MEFEKFKVFIVNLKKDKNRKKHIINELKKQSIRNYEIISAIDGNEFSLPEIISNTYQDNTGDNCWNSKMSPSQIGCALSHIKIYRNFIKTKYDFALILEDDAIFLHNFKDKLKDFILQSFRYKKQIVLLSELKQFYGKPLGQIEKYELVDVANAFFTHAYFINKAAAKSIISFNFPVKTIADNFIFFKIYCGIRITGINPFIVDQDKKNYKTTIILEKNNYKKIYLIKRTIYKLKLQVQKIFGSFKSHSKNI